MPNEKRKKRSARGGFGNFKFVNLDLSQEQRDSYSSFVEARKPTLEDVLYGLADSELKISISQNTDNGVYRLSLTKRDKTDNPGGVVYGVQHSNLVKLLSVGLFCIEEIINDDWSADQDNEYDW